MRTQEELAKWRLEALKSRCIINDRETLLKVNNISFNSLPNISTKMQTIDLPSTKVITDTYLEEVKPTTTTTPKSYNKENIPADVMQVGLNIPHSIGKRNILKDCNENVSMACSPVLDEIENHKLLPDTKNKLNATIDDDLLMEETVCITKKPLTFKNIQTLNTPTLNESLSDMEETICTTKPILGVTSKFSLPKPENTLVHNTSLSDMEETVCISKPIIDMPKLSDKYPFPQTPSHPVYRRLTITPQRVAQLNRFAAAASKPTPTKRSILLNSGQYCELPKEGLELAKKCVNFSDDTKDITDDSKIEKTENNDTSGISKTGKKFVIRQFYIKPKKPTEW